MNTSTRSKLIFRSPSLLAALKEAQHRVKLPSSTPRQVVQHDVFSQARRTQPDFKVPADLRVIQERFAKNHGHVLRPAKFYIPIPEAADIYEHVSQALRNTVLQEGDRLVFSTQHWATPLPAVDSEKWTELKKDLQVLADGHGVTLALKSKSLGEESALEITPYNQYIEQLQKPAMAAMPSLDLSLSLRHELRQELSHTLKLPSIFDQFAEVYEAAEKRTYNKHGLEFTYAVVKRTEFPYLISIGSPGLRFGDITFVMEDFFVDSKIPADFSEMLVEMIAVHEYGELVFGDHHQASLLEFAVAQKEGVLQRYLAFMDKNFFLKFRDVALNRMGPELLEALDASGNQLEGEMPLFDEASGEASPSLQTAIALRDGFRWPKNLHDRYAHVLDEDEGVVTEKMGEWAHRITVNEQVRHYLSKAANEAVAKARFAFDAEGEAVPVIQSAIEAFRKVLNPLAEEFENETLDADNIEKEIVDHALAAAYDEIKEKLGLLSPAVKIALEENSFFTQTFQDHLGVAVGERVWVESFGAAFIKYDVDQEEQASRVESIATDWLQRLVFTEVQKGKKGEDVARRLLTDHAPVLGRMVYRYLQEVDAAGVPVNLREKWFESIVPHFLAGMANHYGDYSDFNALSTPLLQTALDAMAAHLGIPNPLSADALRKLYKRDFSNYPDTNYRKDHREKLWFSLAIGVDNSNLISFIGEQILDRGENDLWNRERAKQIFGKICSGNCPEPLAIFFIKDFLKGQYPFVEKEKDMAALLFTAYQEGVSSKRFSLLTSSSMLSGLISLDKRMKTDFNFSLTSPLAWKVLTGNEGPLANFIQLSEEAPERKLLEDTAPNWLQDVTAEAAISRDAPLAALRKVGSSVDFGVLKNEIDQRLSAMGINLEEISKQRDAIRYGSFYEKTKEKMDTEAMAMASVRDAFALAKIFNKSFPSRLMHPLLADLDKRRREKSPEVTELTLTLVDLDFLQSLSGGAEINWVALLKNYLNLLIVIRDGDPKRARMHLEDEYLEIFGRSGIHALKRGVTLARAARGDVVALQEIIDSYSKQPTTYEEQKDRIRIRNILSDPTLPLPEQFIPHYNQWLYEFEVSLPLLSQLAEAGVAKAKNILGEKRVREIMRAQQLSWRDIGELAELAETLTEAHEALLTIRFGINLLVLENRAPEIAILKKIPPAARNESCLQLLRPVEREELRLRATTDLEALRELVNRGEYVNISPWAKKPEVIPVLLTIMRIAELNWEKIDAAMCLIKFANQGHLSREQWRSVAPFMRGLHRSLGGIEPNFGGEPVEDLISRISKYDWAALKELAERTDHSVEARVFVRWLDVSSRFPDLSLHLTPSAGEAFVALAQAGNLTPVTALGRILPAKADVIEPILRQLAPYSPRAASKVAALERGKR